MNAKRRSIIIEKKVYLDKDCKEILPNEQKSGQNEIRRPGMQKK